MAELFVKKLLFLQVHHRKECFNLKEASGKLEENQLFVQ